MIDFKLQQFTGPLDLLLNLIGQEKLDISEISLSAVTEQYLGYLDKMEEKEPNEMADFLLVAARLLFSKSKNLLPLLQTEEDEGPSLEDQLRLYQAFVEASKKINKRWISTLRSDFRFEPPRAPKQFIPPKNFNQALLHDFFLKLLQRIKPLPDLPQLKIDKAISVRETIEKIRILLQKTKNLSFKQLLEDAHSRTEIIANFLALLELVKVDNVILKQSENFCDIMIEKI